MFRICDAVLARFGIQKHKNSPVTSDVFSEGISIGTGHNALVEFGVVRKHIETFGIKQKV
jgi:phenylalanyl-tRNA synthetase beta chain